MTYISFPVSLAMPQQSSRTPTNLLLTQPAFSLQTRLCQNITSKIIFFFLPGLLQFIKIYHSLYFILPPKHDCTEKILLTSLFYKERNQGSQTLNDLPRLHTNKSTEGDEVWKRGSWGLFIIARLSCDV